METEEVPDAEIQAAIDTTPQNQGTEGYDDDGKD